MEKPIKIESMGEVSTSAPNQHPSQASLSSADVPTSAPSRRRSKVACDTCHYRKIKCDVDRSQPCRNCEKNGVQCTMVGPSMRPPRATSGSSSAAAAAAVAMAMATAAHARFGGLDSGSALPFEDMNDERHRSNFHRGDERFRQGSKTEGHSSAHFNPFQRRPSAPRIDDGLPAWDVHPRSSRRSLQNFSSTSTPLRNLFLSPGTVRSPSISSTSPSSSAPFGISSPHHPRNHPLAQGSSSISSRLTDPTLENYDSFSHSFSHSCKTTPSASSPIVPSGVDRQYSPSRYFAKPSSGPTFSPYSSSPVPPASMQYASRSVDNLWPTSYYARPRCVSPPPMSPPLITHVEHPCIFHSTPRRSASHPLLISSQSTTAIASTEETHRQHSGQRQAQQWSQNQLFGREHLLTSLDSQKYRELGPHAETSALGHMGQTEELEDEFGLPVQLEDPIVRSNSSPAVFSTSSQALGSPGTRRPNEQLHSPVPEQSGVHTSPAAETNSPFFSSTQQFNSSFPPPPPQFSRFSVSHSTGNPAHHQPRRHSEQALSLGRQEPFLASHQSQHLQYWSQHGHSLQAVPCSFSRIRGRSVVDDTRNIHQPLQYFLAEGQQDFHSGYGTHEQQLPTSGARSAFDDTRDISSLPSSALPPTAPTPAAREWDIPEDHEDRVFLKQENELHSIHLDPHHVTDKECHHTTPSVYNQPPLSHALTGQVYGQASSPLGLMSPPSSAQTGIAPRSSSTDVFGASLALVLDDQLHLMDHLSIIRDAPMPGAHALDNTSLAQFGGGITGPGSHSSQAFFSRNSGTLPPSSSSSVSGTSSSAMISSPGGGDTSSSQVFSPISQRSIKTEGEEPSMSSSTPHPFQQHPPKLDTTYAATPGPRQYQQPVAPDMEMMYSELSGQAQERLFMQHPNHRPSGMVTYRGHMVQSDIDRVPHPFDMISSSSAYGSESQHNFGPR